MRINDQITASEIRLIDHQSHNHGVVSLDSAIVMAAEAGLDLVEIAPESNPPVCKILDIGKYKYEQQKRRNNARKKQKVIEVKEIKLRPNIDQHDFDVKMRAARRFLENGDKVKVTLRYRGREMMHAEIGTDLLNKVRGELQDIAKVESEPLQEGRQVLMVLSPQAATI
ncbi:MAG: translation initiation factor IF-3 [Pseudomonadota bacterium]